MDDVFAFIIEKERHAKWNEDAARLFCCDCAELAAGTVGLGYNEPDLIKRAMAVGKSVAHHEEPISALIETRTWIEENRDNANPAAVLIALACVSDNDRIFAEAKALAHFSVALEGKISSRTFSGDDRSYDASTAEKKRQLIAQITRLFDKYVGN